MVARWRLRDANRLTAALLCIVPCFACAPFRIALTFEPIDPKIQMTTLTEDELSRVLTVVSDTAEAFGLEEDPRLSGPDGLKQRTETSDYWSFQLLARYKRVDKATAYSRVEVHVSRDKETSEIIVLVIDRDGDSYEVFTEKLEAALLQSLASAIPSRRIVVTRQ